MNEREVIKYINAHGDINDDVKDIAVYALSFRIPRKPKILDDYDKFIF